MPSTVAPWMTRRAAALQPDVEAAVLAEHHRRGPAEDHAAALGQQAVDLGLGAAPQVVVLVAGGER